MPATLSTSPRAHYRTTAVEADWRGADAAGAPLLQGWPPQGGWGGGWVGVDPPGVGGRGKGRRVGAGGGGRGRRPRSPHGGGGSQAPGWGPAAEGQRTRAAWS